MNNRKFKSSLRTIAEASGLSIMTISDILNRGHAHKYDQATVAKVKRTAGAQKYKPNRAAQALRNNQTRIIGFVTHTLSPAGEIANHVVYPFLVGAAHYLTPFKYHAAVVELAELEPDPITHQRRFLDESFYDGIIVQVGGLGYYKELAARSDVPSIWWDSGVFDPFDCIYRNEIEVAYKMTKELIDLGHRRIGYPWLGSVWRRYTQFMENQKVVGEKEAYVKQGNTLQYSDIIHYSTVHRYHGYLQALQESGLEALPLFHADVYTLSKEIRRTGSTALFLGGAYDMGVYFQAAFLAGKLVPNDLSLASCDVEAGIHSPVGTVHGGMTYDRLKAGQLAAEMMLKRVENPEERVPSIQFTGDFRLGDTISSITKRNRRR